MINSASRLTGAPACDLFNLNGNVAVIKNATLRWGIDNLFNLGGPLIGRGYDPTQYDVLGRPFYIGANFKL